MKRVGLLLCAVLLCVMLLCAVFPPIFASGQGVLYNPPPEKEETDPVWTAQSNNYVRNERPYISALYTNIAFDFSPLYGSVTLPHYSDVRMAVFLDKSKILALSFRASGAEYYYYLIDYSDIYKPYIARKLYGGTSRHNQDLYSDGKSGIAYGVGNNGALNVYSYSGTNIYM